MARNHKLTGVIKGRTLADAQRQDNTLLLTFTDGSVMTVKTAGEATPIAIRGTIKAVRQQDRKLSLDFEDGSVLEIQIAEPTSSVLLRDKNHVFEYAD